MTATFGDFLRPAGQHITAAVLFPGEVPSNARGAVIGQLARLIMTLARYTSDLPLPDEFDPASRPLASPARAALDMRLALRRAAQSLRCVARGLEELPADRSHPVVTHLSAAAGHLAAGSDLLQTHFTVGPSGDRAYRSCWAPAIASEPVTAALLAELAHHARVLAPWAARLAISTPTDPGAPAPACAALHTATRWLWAAGAATETAQPPPAEGQVLLNAIPANVPPPRQSPADGESVPQLCAGIAMTAGRLRHAALAFSAEARWSPAATSASWRRDALASAITGHASQIILRALTQRVPQLAIGQPAEQALQAAVTATARAWSRWRVVTHLWDSASTGNTPGAGPTPVAAEIGDLALRAGRLAYRNPAWTPACARSSATRSPADLAPDRGSFAAVVAAVHTATDAITRIAIQDRQAVRAAAHERRICTPVLPLPPMNNGYRRYRRAEPARALAILASYDTAIELTSHAAAALDDLALAVHAPTTVLALARRAGPAAGQTQRGHSSAQAPAVKPDTGGLEGMLRECEFSDPALLARAAAIDDARRDLLKRAAVAAHRSDQAAQAVGGSQARARPPARSRPASPQR